MAIVNLSVSAAALAPLLRRSIERPHHFAGPPVFPLFLRERYHSFATELLPTGIGLVVAIAGVVLVGSDPAVGELAAGR